jgi:uncharacterized protein
MSERDGYEVGVPCWVDTLQPDTAAAMEFYGDLFGWRFVGPDDVPGPAVPNYFVARLQGADVGGVAPQPAELAGQPARWMTHVQVDSAEAAAERAEAAGGTLIFGPFEGPPAGRMVVLADPTGAVFIAWEPQARKGAQRVNEPSAWSMSMLHSPDPEGAEEFYEAMFGWEAETLDEEAGIKMFRLPGFVGGEPRQPVPRDVVAVLAPIAADASGEAAEPRWSVDFWIDDAERAAETATAGGGQVVVAPHDVQVFRQAVLADPAGGVFSVSQLVADRL